MDAKAIARLRDDLIGLVSIGSDGATHDTGGRIVVSLLVATLVLGAGDTPSKWAL